MTTNRGAKRSIRAKAKRTGMSYQAARNSSQSKLDPCCREFLDAYEKSKDLTPLRAMLHPDLHKNLSPEVDVLNFLVAAHLGAIADKAIQRIHAEDQVVVGIRATATHFEAYASDPDMRDPDVDLRPMTAKVPMPPGLYTHLVEVSKRPRIPIPEASFPKPSADIQALTAKFEELAFGPEAKPNIWVNIETFYKLLRGSRRLLEPMTDRFLLTTGLFGVYTNPQDPADRRAIYVGRFVPKDSVVFDARTGDEIFRSRGLEAECPPREAMPAWLKVGAVIEVRRISDPSGYASWSEDDAPPGRYHVIAVTRAFSLRKAEVVLADMETRKVHVTTAAYLTRNHYGEDQAVLVNEHYWAEVTKDIKPIPLK